MIPMQTQIWYIEGGGFPSGRRDALKEKAGLQFHFGRHGLQMEETSLYFTSDSLFSAIVTRIAFLYGEEKVEAFVKPFADHNPPFLLTSAFPRAGKVLFFPPPKYRVPGGKEPSAGISLKELKKVAFVSFGVFKKLIGGESLSTLWDRLKKYHDNKVLMLAEEVEKLPKDLRTDNVRFWAVEQRPQVTIDRVSQASTLFHVGRVVYNKDCGMWFGVRWRDEEWAYRGMLETIFKELGDAGIGGERSSGYGKCAFAKKDLQDLPDPKPNEPWVTLSRYLPKDNEETVALGAASASYEIATIGGWVTSPQNMAQRRRSVNLILEGSVIATNGDKIPGHIVDVQPDYDGTQPLSHPVWRYGYAFPVALQTAGGIS